MIIALKNDEKLVQAQLFLENISLEINENQVIHLRDFRQCSKRHVFRIVSSSSMTQRLRINVFLLASRCLFDSLLSSPEEGPKGL